MKFRLWYSVPGAQGGTPWCVELDGVARCYAEVRWSGGTGATAFRAQGYSELESGPRGVVEIDCDEVELVAKPTGEAA